MLLFPDRLFQHGKIKFVKSLGKTAADLSRIIVRGTLVRKIPIVFHQFADLLLPCHGAFRIGKDLRQRILLIVLFLRSVPYLLHLHVFIQKVREHLRLFLGIKSRNLGECKHVGKGIQDRLPGLDRYTTCKGKKHLRQILLIVRQEQGFVFFEILLRDIQVVQHLDHIVRCTEDLSVNERLFAAVKRLHCIQRARGKFLVESTLPLRVMPDLRIQRFIQRRIMIFWRPVFHTQRVQNVPNLFRCPPEHLRFLIHRVIFPDDLVCRADDRQQENRIVPLLAAVDLSQLRSVIHRHHVEFGVFYRHVIALIVRRQNIGKPDHAAPGQYDLGSVRQQHRTALNEPVQCIYRRSLFDEMFVFSNIL